MENMKKWKLEKWKQWYRMVPYGTIWYNIVPYGTIWYLMVPCAIIFFQKDQTQFPKQFYVPLKKTCF